MDARLFPTTTHDVTNQSGPLLGVNVFDGDVILRDAVEREGAGWIRERASRLGAAAGQAEWQEHAQLANKQLPTLRTHDRFGNRIDTVDFHPSYHALMGLAFGSGVHSLAWTTNHPAPHTARAALSYVWNQIENGVGCPTGMAYSAVPSLRLVAGGPCRVGSEGGCRGLRSAPAPLFGQERRDDRHGADREAGRVGSQSQHHEGGCDEWRWTRRGIPSDRAQVVLLGADERRFSDFGAAPRKGRAASSCRACCPTGATTASSSSGSRTSAATSPTPPARSSIEDTYALLLGEEGRGIRTAIEMAHLTRLDFAIGSAGPDALGPDAHAASRGQSPNLSAHLERPAAHAQRARRSLPRIRERRRSWPSASRAPSTRRRRARTRPACSSAS